MRSWVVVLSLCVGAVGAAHASTLTVTSFTDINPGSPAGLGPGVSGDLRAAIKSSNAGDVATTTRPPLRWIDRTSCDPGI